MAAKDENVFKRVTQRHKATKAAPVDEDSQPVEPPKSKRGKGKSSDPDYRQIGVYCHKDVYRKAKAKLALHELEFSQLIEDLLDRWVKEE